MTCRYSDCYENLARKERYDWIDGNWVVAEGYGGDYGYIDDGYVSNHCDRCKCNGNYCVPSHFEQPPYFDPGIQAPFVVNPVRYGSVLPPTATYYSPAEYYENRDWRLVQMEDVGGFYPGACLTMDGRCADNITRWSCANLSVASTFVPFARCGYASVW